MVYIETLNLQVTPLCISVSSYFTQKMSFFIGRIGATVAMKAIGTSCLLAICLLVAFDNREGAGFKTIIIVVYVLRTAFMNSTKPLTKSIIMDVVPVSSCEIYE